jgi:predicted nucleic acid-binding protein
MKIVVDSNKLISAAISPYGKTAEILLSTPSLEKFAPAFLKQEILIHQGKMEKLAKLSSSDLRQVITSLFKQITFVKETEIPTEVWKRAEEICMQVDPKDIPYVALSIYLNAELWTGDKPLGSQLTKEGYSVVKTSDLEVFIDSAS